MTQTQIIKTFELIDEKFDNLSNEQFENLAAGTGMFAMLEDIISEVFGVDEAGCEDFWKHINSVHGTNERPDLAMLSFQIIDRYFTTKWHEWYNDNVKTMTIRQLKQVTFCTYVVIYTYNIDMKATCIVYSGYIDEIPARHDNITIEDLNCESSQSQCRNYLTIHIGDSIFTEADFND